MVTPPAPAITCASEHTITLKPDHRLVSTRCTREPEHRGMCIDEHGRQWTRASELHRLDQAMAAQAHAWARQAAEAQRAERSEGAR